MYSAVINLTGFIIYDLNIFLPSSIKIAPFVTVFLSLSPYFNYLSVCSLLPLAVNRSFLLYFPILFEKIFSIFKMLLFLIIYDLLICSYVYVKDFSQSFLVQQGLFLITMTSSIILSLCLLIKIKGMKKMANKSTLKKSILNDLFRAAILCLVQPIGLIIILIVIIAFLPVYEKMYSRESYEISPILLKGYLFYSNFYTEMYEIFVTIDACMMLLFLKSYRSGVRFIWNRVSPWKVQASVTTNTYFNRSVVRNNFMNK